MVGRAVGLAVVAVVAGLAALVGEARADFAPPPDTMVVSTAACPGFAPSYPAFPDPIFGGDGQIDPAGPYLFVPTADVTLVHEQDFRNGGGDLTGVAYLLRVDGADASGTYSLDGEFHSKGSPGPPGGDGQLRIVRADGARMWGPAFVATIAHRGDHLVLGFSGAPHCAAAHA